LEGIKVGMYDYLGDYQIKIFNIPIYYGKEYGMGYIGGQLRSYYVGEDLTLQTLWYKYPDNFTILDENAFNGDDEQSKSVVHIIKNSKYFNTVLLEEFDEKYIGENVYDYYGTLLNIRTKNDMYNFIKLKQKLKEKQNELEKSFFPEGAFECIKNDMDKYDKLEPQYHSELNNLNNKYSSKLYLKEVNQNEMTLGAYIDVAIEAFNEKDEKADKFRNPKERYEEIISLTKEFINTLEKGYIDKYFDWLDSYCNEEHKDLIRKFIENEIMV
jgi:hypothetical protein